MNLIGAVLLSLSVVSVIVINTQDAAVDSAQSPSRQIFKKKANLNLLSSNIKNLLRNSKSIDGMMKANISNFSCVVDGTPCNVIRRDVTVLSYANNQEYLNTTKTGFDFNGNICSLSKNNCDLALDIKWRPDCGSTCSNPAVIMEIKFIPLRDQITNIAKFNFDVNLCTDNGFCDL